MNNLMLHIILIILAYIIGSISSAILLCNIFKLPDPRTFGSKNPGTTNVLRLAGKKLAALVLLCDASKSFISVYLVNYLIGSNVLTALVAISVLIGNLFPIFFNFAGGKGIATTLGIMLALSWQLSLLAITIWILTFIKTRISSVAALTTTLAIMCLSIIVCCLGSYSWIQKEFAISIILISILIIFQHRTNIFNLCYQLEKKI